MTDTDKVSGYTRTCILLLTNGNDSEMIFTDDDSRIVTIKKVKSREEASPGEIYLEIWNDENRYRSQGCMVKNH